MTDHDTELGIARPILPAVLLPDVSGYLLPGEEVQYLDRRHPVVLTGTVLIVLAVIVFMGMLVSTAGAGVMVGLAGWITIGAFVWLAVRVLRWLRTVLVVSNRRVFEYRAMLISRAAIKPVFRQGIVFRQDPIGRRLNYGTVMTRSPAGEPIHTFKWTHNPLVFYQVLTDLAH